MSEQPEAKRFGALKQIDAGLLSVGYAEVGPADGRAVLLLPGWPYDIHCYAAVAPVLGASGPGIQPRKDRHERTLAHARRAAHRLGPAAR